MKRFVKKPRRTPTKKTQTKQTPPPLLPLPVLLLTEQHALDQRLRAQVLPLDDPQQHQTISCEPEHERRDGGAGDGKEQHRAYVGEEAPLLQGHSCREDDGREQAVEKSRGREAQGGCEAGEPDDDARGDAQEHRRGRGREPCDSVPLDEEGGDDGGDEQEPDEEELDLWWRVFGGLKWRKRKVEAGKRTKVEEVEWGQRHRFSDRRKNNEMRFALAFES